MELISREELLKQIETDSKGHEGQHGDEWLFINTINSLPTIEERKEGRWVRITQDVGLKTHQYMCTECHRIIEYSSFELPCLLEMKFPYCHCGAKMKGEANDIR